MKTIQFENNSDIPTTPKGFNFYYDDDDTMIFLQENGEEYETEDEARMTEYEFIEMMDDEFDSKYGPGSNNEWDFEEDIRIPQKATINHMDLPF